MSSQAATVVQVFALVGVVAGLYLLAGLAVTLIVVGGLIFIGSVVIELASPPAARADVRASARERGR